MKQEYISPTAEIIRPGQSLLDSPGDNPKIIVSSDTIDDGRAKGTTFDDDEEPENTCQLTIRNLWDD